MSKNPSDIIAAKRADLHLSMEQAAECAGITRQGWWMIESGKIQNPSMQTCLGIARALGCELKSIWTWAR